MGWYTVWSDGFILLKLLVFFPISSSVTGLSCRKFLFARFKCCLGLAFDLGVFMLIMFAIEPKKLLHLQSWSQNLGTLQWFSRGPICHT